MSPNQSTSISAKRLPYSVQSATAEDIENSISLDLSDFMNRNLQSVHINQAQNNPLQPDVQYRGFTASPLLGNAQGLSVYLNGVRINEPFGDTVNWDIVPDSAISQVLLFSGSNPLFGLNTLGGALSLRTKTGFTHPGHSVELLGGSFGRFSGEFESGTNADNHSYYITGNWFNENGWRDHSASDAKKLFASTGFKNDATEYQLTLSLADTNLNGNGPAPVELLHRDRNAVFTYPDNTRNNLTMITLSSDHAFSATKNVSVLAYTRSNKQKTFNADGSDFEVVHSVNAAGSGRSESGNVIIAGDVCGGICSVGDLVENGELIRDQNALVINTSLEEDDLAINNRSFTDQMGLGFNIQFGLANTIAAGANNLVVGVSYDYADIGYVFDAELAGFTQDRGTLGTGFIQASSTVDADISSRIASLYVLNSFSLHDKFSLTLSGRYNDVRIRISGMHGDSSVVPDGETGVNRFSRLNLAAGVTYAINGRVTSYAGYSESSRVPTPAELTCHDVDNPCALPNSFLSDPPLDQVVAKTWEAGLRGEMTHLQWHLGLFRTTNHKDIYFLPTRQGPGLSPGYFGSIGDTRRSGIELSLSAEYERWRWFLNYSRIRAEFRDNFELHAPNNPGAVLSDEQNLLVTRGNLLPGIPRRLAKLGIQWSVTTKLSVTVEALYNDRSYYRGDEANVSDKVSRYAVLGLLGNFSLHDHLAVFARVDNLLDRKYENFGLFGEPDEAPGFAEFTNPRFLGAGAPRGIWIGARFTF